MKTCIAIYGVGLEAEKFYWNNTDKFEIAYAIDRVSKQDFHGIKVYSIDYVIRNLPKVPIVVTCGSGYREICTILKGYDLIEFKDFIWCEYIDRKMVLLYGNCHMGALENYLMNNPYFSKQYIVRRFCVTEEQPSIEELEACTILITQDINEQNKLGVFSAQEVIERVSSTCKKIIIPNLYGCNLFFPQLYESEEWKKNHLNDENGEYYEATVRRIGIADENIRKLWREGKDITYILNVIKNEEVYTAESIIENFEKQMKKLESREAKCDIHISDYIEKNYREKKLFFEPGHPSEDVIYEIGRRICGLLHIEIEEEFLPPCRMDTIELFIYGCVYRALKLKFQQNFVRRCDHSATIYNRPINLEEYVRQSIIWLYEK